MFLLGDVEGAEQEWILTLALGTRVRFIEGIAYGLEGLSGVAALRGDGWRAGALVGAAGAIRQTTGIFDVSGFAVHLPPLTALRESDPERVAAGERAGAEMSVDEAIALALPDADRVVEDALARW